MVYDVRLHVMFDIKLLNVTEWLGEYVLTQARNML